MNYYSSARTCTVGERLDSANTGEGFKWYVRDYGYAAVVGTSFTYVKKWSDYATWGYDQPPLEGEAVHVPVGSTLLMDVDETPLLSFVLVEGTLIL
jgi:hypothetical protein